MAQATIASARRTDDLAGLARWLTAELDQWLHTNLQRDYEKHLEGVFDHSLLGPLIRLFPRLAEGYPLSTKERKSLTTQLERQLERKMDLTHAHRTPAGGGREVFFGENSLSKEDKPQHGCSDRVKLFNALFAALHQLCANEPGVDHSTFGVHLRDNGDGIVQLLGYQARIDRGVQVFHTLFEVPMPLHVQTPLQLQMAATALCHMVALLQLMFEQLARNFAHAAEIRMGSRGDSDSHGGSGPGTGGGARDRGSGGYPGSGGGGGGGSWAPINTPMTKKSKSTSSSKQQQQQPKEAREALADAVQGVYTLEHWGVDDGAEGCTGAFSHVFPAVSVAQPADTVVFKLQCEHRHTVELHTLKRLCRVDGVIRVLDYFSCGPRYALMLPRLLPLDYDAIKCQVKSVVGFADRAVSIVGVVHEMNVAHGDVKPEAFMRDPTTQQVLLVDFNLAGDASQVVDGADQLPGTPGWILNDVPATRREHGDLIGLASVLGWLLAVDGLGDPHTSHADAIEATKDALNRSCESAPTMLLRLVLRLLHLQPLANIWPPQDAGPAEGTAVQVGATHLQRCFSYLLCGYVRWVLAYHGSRMNSSLPRCVVYVRNNLQGSARGTPKHQPHNANGRSRVGQGDSPDDVRNSPSRQ